MKAGEVVLFRNDVDVDYSRILRSPVVHLTVIAPISVGKW